MDFFNNKKSYIIIVIASIIVLGTIGIYVYKTHNTNEEEQEIEEQTEDEEEIKQEIMVHVTGEVNKPGIVVLEEGDRVIDAIEEAGGATQNANLNSINLAENIRDSEKIYVPNINETEEIQTNNTKNENKPININTATEQELSQLDGIGFAIANKIIEYRKENKKFNTTEELKNIQGIGEAKYEQIKDKVTIK